MNILLTGGTGYVGSHIVVSLFKAGYKPVIFDNFCNSQWSVFGRLRQILGNTLSCIEGDVRNTPLLEKVLRSHKIEAVVHLAGLKAVGESVADPIKYYENNVQGAISLLTAMKSTNVKNLVFSSSATVYGNPEYLPIDEAHPASPTNPYGRNKLTVEEMLKDVALSDLSWKILCLRYFNPVGAHDSGLIGEDSGGVPNNLMPYITNVALRKEPVLNIYGNDYLTIDGTGVRDYVHVMDLADGHLAAIKFLGCHFGWSAINLGTGRGFSVLEVIRAFEDACKVEIPYQFVGRRPGDIAACFAKVDLAKNILQWQAKRNLREMCEDSWRFCQYDSYNK